MLKDIRSSLLNRVTVNCAKPSSVVPCQKLHQGVVEMLPSLSCMAVLILYLHETFAPPDVLGEDCLSIRCAG